MTNKVTPQQVKDYRDAWREAMFNPKMFGVDYMLLWFIQDTNYDTVFMSQSTMSEKTGHTRKAIGKAIKNLEKLGYIKVQRPPKGSKKPLKVELSDALRPPTKYIFFVSQSEDMKTSHGSSGTQEHESSGLMKKNKVEPVMGPLSTTNGINGNNINGLENKSNSPIKGDNTPGNTDLSLTAGQPISNFPDYFSVARDEVAKSGVTFTDTNFSYAVEMFKRSRKAKNQKNLESWLLGSYLKESDKKTKQIGVYSTKGVISK